MTKDKSLISKAIKIQGKDYVQVADRIIYFNDAYPNGSIRNKLVSDTDSERVVIKAFVTPDHKNPMRYFVAYSQAKWGDGAVNKTSALENCETSAVGRALGMMGIGVIETIASVDEMNKAGVAGSIAVPEPRLVKKLDLKCPDCGSPLIEAQTKAGKTFHKCSTSNYVNGSEQGCAFVNWSPGQKAPTHDKKHPYKDKSKTVSAEDYIG